jgi:hypothetical protein
MESTQPTNLWGAAESYWRSFFPAWIFPFVFFYGGAVSDSLGHPDLFFVVVALPLFFWCFFRATRPWLHHQVKYWHCIFWAMVVPFLIGIVAVGSRLALLGLLHGGGKA